MGEVGLVSCQVPRWEEAEGERELQQHWPLFQEEPAAEEGFTEVEAAEAAAAREYQE